MITTIITILLQLLIIIVLYILNSLNSELYTITTVLRPFFRDHPGELVPEELFWTLWCKGRLTEADTDHPAGSHSIRTNQCRHPSSPHFLQAGCPSYQQTKSVKALKEALSEFLGDRL